MNIKSENFLSFKSLIPKIKDSGSQANMDIVQNIFSSDQSIFSIQKMLPSLLNLRSPRKKHQQSEVNSSLSKYLTQHYQTNSQHIWKDKINSITNKLPKSPQLQTIRRTICVSPQLLSGSKMNSQRRNLKQISDVPPTRYKFPQEYQLITDGDEPQFFTEEIVKKSIPNLEIYTESSQRYRSHRNFNIGTPQVKSSSVHSENKKYSRVSFQHTKEQFRNHRKYFCQPHD